LSHRVRMKEPDTRRLGAPVVPYDEASLMCVAASRADCSPGRNAWPPA